MKEFTSPVIVDIADLAEGVYAASGSTSTEDPVIPAPGVQGWNWSIEWANHNSGSHSEMNLKGLNNSGQGGNHIKVVLTFVGQGQITSVTSVSKATSYSYTQNSITFEYDGVYNGFGENICIGYQITFDGAPNADRGNSYWPSGTNCNTSAAGEFVISYIECN